MSGSGVEGVTKAVADEVDAEYRERDHHAGCKGAELLLSDNWHIRQSVIGTAGPGEIHGGTSPESS